MYKCCFVCVFLRESARTAAKRRTNLSTNSGKATKRMCRLAPNVVHMCKFIWEWIYSKQIAPRDTRGHFGGFRGSTIHKYGETVRLAPTLVHVCVFIYEWTSAECKSPLNTPRWHWGGGVGGHKFKAGEAVKRLHRLAPNLVHVGGFV